jgi:hypothetical protein
MARTLFITILLIQLLIGCQIQSTNLKPSQTTQADNTPATENTSSERETSDPTEAVETLDPVQACMDNPDHPIGLQISAEFETLTSYEQVMSWFCSGFVFDDILTALQTAEVSDFPADFLLTMLEYGQSWEEIWIEIGLE